MNLAERIENVLLEGVQKSHFPGAHYAVVFDHGCVIKGYVGYRRTHPDREPLQGDEIYDVASLTKVVSTTTLVMKLIEQGQLLLDTKVSEILPLFHHETITIEHLLTHTSGLPADIPRANTLRHKDDVLQHLYTVTPIHPVGEKIVYSDIGFLLLGLVIQKITKKSLPVLAQEWIFEPLRMTDTSYHPNPSRSAPTEYRDDAVHKGLLQGRVHDEKAFAMDGIAGHAGLFSTASDLAKFIGMYLKQEDSVLRATTQREMFVARAKDVALSGYPLVRAYGFDKPTPHGSAGDLVDFEHTIVHTGFTGCNLWIDTAHGVGFVLLSNAVHPRRDQNGIQPYRTRLGNLIIQSIKEDHYETITR
jgi:CubicO group peptidase (beta-lactamase class C family)